MEIRFLAANHQTLTGFETLLGLASINYTLPQTVHSAKIVVTDTAGKAVKQMSLSSGPGAGHIIIKDASWSPGIYFFSLYVDNTLIDTKKMAVTK